MHSACRLGQKLAGDARRRHRTNVNIVRAQLVDQKVQSKRLSGASASQRQPRMTVLAASRLSSLLSHVSRLALGLLLSKAPHSSAVAIIILSRYLLWYAYHRKIRFYLKSFRP